jgi:hypothetical protein
VCVISTRPFLSFVSPCLLELLCRSLGLAFAEPPVLHSFYLHSALFGRRAQVAQAAAAASVRRLKKSHPATPSSLSSLSLSARPSAFRDVVTPPGCRLQLHATQGLPLTAYFWLCPTARPPVGVSAPRRTRSRTLLRPQASSLLKTVIGGDKFLPTKAIQKVHTGE